MQSMTIRLVQFVFTAFTRLLLAVVAIAIAFGIPLFWIWVGSHVQQGTAPSLSAILVVLGGIAGSYIAVGYIFAWVRAKSVETGVVRHAWNRSMRDTPYEAEGGSHVVEQVMIIAVLLVVAAFSVWFFLFANPGAPQV